MAAMIRITPRVAIAEEEIGEAFIRAPGPGGQHVNTTASAVELRFDAARSSSLPEDVRHRLLARADRRITQEGVIVIVASEHRSQIRNREAALERLVEMIRAATIVPRVRRATRPTLASKKRRLDAKSRRSTIKAFRRDLRDD
jgi:ribosome-associated protein